MDNLVLQNFIDNHTDDCVNIINNFAVKEIIDLIHSLPEELSSKILNNMNLFKAVRCIESIDQLMAAKLLEKCNFTTATRIFRMMDKNVSEKLLDSVSPEFTLSIRKSITYPEHSIGAYLDPSVYTLQADMTIEKALKDIREYGEIVQSPIFVLSEDHKLVGYIDLKILLTNDSSKIIGSVLNTHVSAVSVNMNVQSFMEDKSIDYGFAILPVVDVQGVFLGVFNKKHIRMSEHDETSRRYHIQQAGVALGDLYQIGLSSFIKNTSEIFGDLK